MRFLSFLKFPITFILGIMLLFTVSFANAATYTSVTSGNWDVDATWSGTGVPVAGDIVTIANGHTVTVAVPGACTSITFAGASTASASLIVNSTLTVSGAVTLNSCNTAAGFNTACAISGTGTLSCGSVLLGTDFNTTTATTRTTIMTSTITNFDVSGNLTIASFIGSTATRIINSRFNLESGTANIDGEIITTNQNGANTSTFSMASGAQSGTLLLSDADPFSLTGTGTSTITLNGTTATVNYDGNAQAILGTTYRNLTTSGSDDKTLGAAITVQNNLFVGSGTRLIDSENQITGNATGTFTVENNATLFLGRVAVSGTISTLFPTNFTKAHIDLQAGSMVLYNSWVAQTVSYVPDYYHLQFQYPGAKSTSGAGTLTIDGNFYTASPASFASATAVDVAGDFNLLGAPLIFTCPGTGGTLSIGGTFDNDITVPGGSFVPNGGTVTFNGSAAQSITGTGAVATFFYNLTINNTAGGVSVALSTPNDDVTVTNTLTMTNGILTTSSTNLLNVTRTTVGAISGGTATSFINGPVKWTLPISLASGSTYVFPVGKGSTYLPFSLVNPTTGAGVAGSITAQVEAFNTNCGGTANFSNIGSLSTTEYWSLTTTGSFTNTSVSLSRPTAISPLDAIAGSTTVNGTYASLAGTVGANAITTSSAIGTNRFFVFGRKNGIRTSTITGSPFCLSGSVSVPYTVAASSTFAAGTVFTAQLSDASGDFTLPVNIGSFTQTPAGNFPGTISATIPAGSAAGTGYRIRVVGSTTLQTVGSDNGTDLTINANNTVGAASSSPNACISIPMTSITHATTGATGIGTATGLPSGVTATWASNTITISGIPSVLGTFNYSIPLSGGCGSVLNATGTITVNSNATIALTSAAGTAAQTLCNNTAITNIVYTVANGGTGASITAGALPAGVTGIFSGSTFTISGTPTALGTFNYTVTTSGGCSSASLGGTITVNPCIYTWKGSISSDWSTGGNWSDGAAPGVGDDALIPSAGVTNMPISAGTASTRNLTIQSGPTLTVNGNTLTVNGNLVINSGGILTITSPGALSAKVNITNNGTLSGTGTTTLNGVALQTISGSGTYGNITLNNAAGGAVSGAVTISGVLTLTNGALASGGNLTINLNAGAIGGATSTGSITGNIILSKTANSSGYHYLSSPFLSGGTVADWNDDVTIKYPQYANLYYYDETNPSQIDTDGWTVYGSSMANPLTVLKGYALYFNGAATIDQTGTYTHGSVPSNVTLTNTISGLASVDGWNLVGNPYPSTIDWKSDLVTPSSWTKTGIGDAIYCWDAANSRYTTFVGGLGTNGGSRYIPSMQAFWVRVNNAGTGTLGMTNAARVTSTNLSLWRTAANANSNILKLTATSGNYSDETIIRFADDVTNDFDDQMDAYKLKNDDNTPSLYSMLGTDEYAINSLADITIEDVTIPLHLKAGFTGEYTIHSEEMGAFDSGYEITLVDSLLDISQDLRSVSDYSFQVNSGDTTGGRFFINFRKAATTAIKNQQAALSKINITSVESTVYLDFINISSNTGDIGVYNLLGRQIADVKNADISSGQYSLSFPGETGIYMVKVVANGEVFTKKIYLR